MSHDKKPEKFKNESQDARRRDEHNLAHPDNKSGKNTPQRHDKKNK